MGWQGGICTKKGETLTSAGKVMATVFWDSQEIIFIGDMEKGKTIAGAYYSSLLDSLQTKLQEKRPRSAHKKLFSITITHQLVITSVVLVSKMEIGFQLVSHSPYSPDLAPSDYYFFLNTKK